MLPGTNKTALFLFFLMTALAGCGESANAPAAKTRQAGEVNVPPLAGYMENADPSRGQSAAGACAACHSFSETGRHNVGPRLWDVVGREIGTSEGFIYSRAMASTIGNWTPENLNHYLADPDRYIPGTMMNFEGIADPQERADLILFLQGLAPRISETDHEALP